MNMKASIELFLAAIVFGMGFTIGVGLIRFVVGVAARSVGADVSFLH